MRPRRITPYYPYTIRADEEPTVEIVLRRGKKIGKWAALIVGIPIGYLWIPFSCCFRSPVSKVVFDKDPEVVYTAADKISENFSTIVYGATAVVTCGCCCFGCCGSVEPKEV